MTSTAGDVNGRVSQNAGTVRVVDQPKRDWHSHIVARSVGHFTTSDSAAEVDGCQYGVPPYVATIECFPFEG